MEQSIVSMLHNVELRNLTLSLKKNHTQMSTILKKKITSLVPNEFFKALLKNFKYYILQSINYCNTF